MFCSLPAQGVGLGTKLGFYCQAQLVQGEREMRQVWNCQSYNGSCHTHTHTHTHTTNTPLHTQTHTHIDTHPHTHTHTHTTRTHTCMRQSCTACHQGYS